jgi:hypothetical protein
MRRGGDLLRVAQMATQVSTFPLGSSTGGLTYVFDESIGTFRRGSASFGPLFAERALPPQCSRITASPIAGTSDLPFRS